MTTSTLKAKTATYTNIASAMKKSQVEVQTPFITSLCIQGFEVSQISDKEITITNNINGLKYYGLVFGSKVVIFTGKAINKSGLSMKLNHSVALDKFDISQHVYVLDLENNTVKAGKYAYGWIPSESVNKFIGENAQAALASTGIISTKPSDGAIEHFVSGHGQHFSTSSIADVRDALFTIIQKHD